MNSPQEVQIAAGTRLFMFGCDSPQLGHGRGRLRRKSQYGDALMGGLPAGANRAVIIQTLSDDRERTTVRGTPNPQRRRYDRP